MVNREKWFLWFVATGWAISISFWLYGLLDKVEGKEQISFTIIGKFGTFIFSVYIVILSIVIIMKRKKQKENKTKD